MLKTPEKKVNVQELLDLADFMEKLPPEKYDQSEWGWGITACICGWQHRRKGRRASVNSCLAAEELGLSYEQASLLFRGAGGAVYHKGTNYRGVFSRALPQDAARCLRELAMTGEVPEWWKPREI